MKCPPIASCTFFSGFTSLFICGGYSATSTGALVDATVMDMPSLDGSPPARNCLQVPDMPGAKNAHFSMWDGDDRSVLACGGESPEFPQGKKCYKYLGRYDWMGTNRVEIWALDFSLAHSKQERQSASSQTAYTGLIQTSESHYNHGSPYDEPIAFFCIFLLIKTSKSKIS